MPGVGWGGGEEVEHQMIFRGNGRGISRRQQSIKDGRRQLKIESHLTANEGKGTLKILQSHELLTLHSLHC